MYNRYIPQPDGSFRRNRMPDPQKPAAPASTAPPLIPEPYPEPEQTPASPPPCRGCTRNKQRPPLPPSTPKPPQSTSVTNFLKQLLPGNFDTEDLLILILLLLMAGENQENRNSALLTLALYLFL